MRESAAVATLRRTLYLGALFTIVGGPALAIAPHFWLVRVFGQPPYPDYAGARMMGVGTFTFGLLMVIVAHHAEEAWWWSWAFVITSTGFALIALSQALFGNSPSRMWWGIAVSNAIFAGSLVWGLARTGTERPPI